MHKGVSSPCQKAKFVFAERHAEQTPVTDVGSEAVCSWDGNSCHQSKHRLNLSTITAETLRFSLIRYTLTAWKLALGLYAAGIHHMQAIANSTLPACISAAQCDGLHKSICMMLACNAFAHGLSAD